MIIKSIYQNYKKKKQAGRLKCLFGKHTWIWRRRGWVMKLCKYCGVLEINLRLEELINKEGDRR